MTNKETSPTVPTTPPSALQIFEREGKQIRSILLDDEPWFFASDVCHALGLVRADDSVRLLDSDEKRRVNTAEISGSIRGNPNRIVVNESGLYALIFASEKATAKVFRKWVTSEVLPAIRKTGTYTIDLVEELEREVVWIKAQRDGTNAALTEVIDEREELQQQVQDLAYYRDQNSLNFSLYKNMIDEKNRAESTVRKQTTVIWGQKRKIANLEALLKNYI